MGACQAHLYPFPYSVDNDRFVQVYLRRLGERQLRLARLGLDPSLPVLLFCGKLIRLKRVDLLLDAVSVAGLAQHVNILVVGDGELREELQARARGLGLEHVAFLGFLNQSEMPLAYVLGDLLCLLSDVPETWGLVVNEALACGRPVMVSSHCGCVPDLVEDKGTGWIVPPGNVVATSQALRDAVTHAARWPEMGRRGQAVVARHNFEAMAQGLMAALHNL
jgi:glycosyltransferase involved in cell wall biosynthesis